MIGPLWAPLPKLLPPDAAHADWTVLQCEPANAKVSVHGREMHLPKPQLGEDILVHMHELGHVTDVLAPDAPDDGGRRGTEVRQLMRRMLDEIAVEVQCKVDIRRARDHLDWPSWPLPTERHQLAAMYLQLANSASESRNAELRAYFDKVCYALSSEDRRAVVDALLAVQDNPSHANRDAWADKLGDTFAIDVDPATGKGETKAAKDAREEAEAEEKEAEESAERAERNASDSDQVAEKRAAATARGKLDIHMHTAMRRGSRTIASTWRATDLGTVIRRPELLIPSGRIFAQRAAGGAILIDYSGSMRWNHGTLVAGLAKLPRLWAAAYSGAVHLTGGKPPPYIGRLCIVARDGRVGDWDEHDERATHGGENAIDSLALQYMTEHARGPYVWVSDGQVLGDEPQHHTDCDRLMSRHAIVRVASLEHAIEYLLGHVAYGWRDTDPGVYHPYGMMGGAGRTPAKPLHK